MRSIGPPRRRQRVRASQQNATGKEDQGGVQNRRIYDPRRWHKRRNGSSTGGQPPAGWVLLWAGRFKRWRRRWFVAHPPGLLLYYKNSDQMGRPSCINLLGARIVADPNKDRQIKIAKGSNVYYIRTINREYRQAWLDAISESLRTYNNSLQKAAVGGLPGLPPEPCMHLREECMQQERVLDQRMSERLQEVEPTIQAFLQQLHGLQRSLSVISESLGFANNIETNSSGNVASSTLENDHALGQYETRMTSVHGPPALKDRVKDKNTPRSLFKRKASKHHHDPHMTADTSVSVAQRIGGSTGKTLRWNRSLSFPFDDALSSSEYMLLHEQGRCIGKDCFKWRKKHEIEPYGSKHGNLSDSQNWIDNLQTIPTELSVPDDDACGEHNLQDKENATNDVRNMSVGYGSPEGSPVMPDSRHMMPKSSASPLPTTTVNHGSLHTAWIRLQDAYMEVLREEVRRIIELEAENAALQESLALLPQLQKDRLALQELRSRLQRDGKEDLSMESQTGEGSDDEESEDEISIVPTEVTNEEYFEALEVLNQHEFLARTTYPEEQEGLEERVDGAHEPPEEGECLVDLDVMSEAELEDSDQPRMRLPAPRPLSMGFSLWTVLKNAIGKDLNHITMPATINEPLSALQRCAEHMQYRGLLESASQCESSMERLLLVSAFACATYSGSIYRDAKPFNPMLGETYEWQAPDGKARFLSEQVSHHPPILAFQGESTAGDFIFYGEFEIKNKFWGRSVEVIPAGACHVRIPKYADHFTWNQVTTCVHNVIVGKLWIDNYGEMVVRNHRTGETSRIRFHKASTKEQGRISGMVYDHEGVSQFALHGNYMKKILVSVGQHPNNGLMDLCDSRVLWEVPKAPEDYHQQYCFSQFAIGLNELTAKLTRSLPPTDSRFRSDQRALENGDLEKATPEKLRLEEKQRIARRLRKEQGQEWEPLWFKKNLPVEIGVHNAEDKEFEATWTYRGDYWGSREQLLWHQCPDIM